MGYKVEGETTLLAILGQIAIGPSHVTRPVQVVQADGIGVLAR
jgi:hypothetical protein